MIGVWVRTARAYAAWPLIAIGLAVVPRGLRETLKEDMQAGRKVRVEAHLSALGLHPSVFDSLLAELDRLTDEGGHA